MNSNIYGAGLDDLKFYRSPYKLQKGKNLKFNGGNYMIIRGRGLGQVLRGVWTSLHPVLLQALPFLKNVAREALEGGAEVLRANLETNKSFSDLAKEESSKRFKNISEEARKQIFKGSGLRKRKQRKYIKKKDKTIPSVIKGLLFRSKAALKKAPRKNKRKNYPKKKKDSDKFFE